MLETGHFLGFLAGSDRATFTQQKSSLFQIYSGMLSPVTYFSTVGLPLEPNILSQAESLSIFMPPELKSACLKRKEDFIAGRYSAFLALRLFEPQHTYKMGAHLNGSPIWPCGYTGSITHTRDFAAAAVAKSCDILGLGIDSEKIIPEENAREISKNVLTGRELKFYSETGSSSFKINEYVCLFFSAKESIYKCLNPLTQTIIRFSDVEITYIELERHSLRFRLLKNLNEDFLNGYEISVNYLFSDGYIHTAAELKTR